MHCKKLSFQSQLFVCLLALVAVRCIYAADPLQFVRIQEDMGPGRIHDLHTPGQVSQILRADANSTLRITIDPTALGADAALNRIRMSATLAQRNGSAKPVNVEIVGYSQIDVAPISQSSQNAAAFETADQIQSDISSLYFTTSDLIQTIYGAGSDCVQNPRQTHCADLSTVAGNRDTISNRLALFRPEILRIGEDVADPNKAALIQLVGASIFGLTPATILDIRTQLETDLITALDPQKKDDQRDAALEELAQRVRLVWIDLQEISNRIGALQATHPDLSTQAAAAQVFAEL
ncbi:MAG TPA: hypothetical protein VKV15_14620, partial [Bryobacteraceae bacterium]|nr:hypothetical protein [Bryobacteraceae bacterium]